MANGRNPPRLTAEQAAQFWGGVAFAERFFMGLNEVHRAMEKLSRTLRDEGIPYAIADAMALNAYGYRRVTTDVATSPCSRSSLSSS